jgi:hypothetical protein
VDGAEHFATDHFLGQGAHDIDLDILSPRHDEQKIAVRIGAVGHMLDRCEETVQHISQTIIVRPKSTQPYSINTSCRDLQAEHMSMRL